MKKNVNVRQKVEQKPVKKNDSIEFSKLIIILSKLSSTQRERDIEEAQKQYELYKTLNPRYFEKIIPLKDAMLKVYSSDIIFSSYYNIFRSW